MNINFDKVVKIFFKTAGFSQMVVAQAFNPSTQETEVVGSLRLRPAWSTEQVPEQQDYTEKPCLKKAKQLVLLNLKKKKIFPLLKDTSKK